jgi:hypothetical protein
MAETELPIALSRFAQRLGVGHEDKIWTGPLQRFHGQEKHTVAEWQKLIEALKTLPVPRT